MTEHLERHNRIGVGQLPDQECEEADDRNDGEPYDHWGFEPIIFLAEVEHDLKRTDPDDEKQKADAIDAGLARWRFL